MLEVDGQLVDLVRERMGLRTSPQLQVTVGDARTTLRDEPAGRADVVVGDAFSTYAAPWHLATREWMEDVRRVLSPRGLYAVNVVDLPPNDLLRAQAATLPTLFDDVRLVAIRGAGGDPGGGNAVLLASDRPLPDGIGFGVENADSYSRRFVERFAAGGRELRDDFAPVDQPITSPS